MSKKIAVDEETYLVIKNMQDNLITAGVKPPTMGEALKMLLCHRQPGGWSRMVENAKIAEIRRETTYVR